MASFSIIKMTSFPIIRMASFHIIRILIFQLKNCLISVHNSQHETRKIETPVLSSAGVLPFKPSDDETLVRFQTSEPSNELPASGYAILEQT